jgi:hypothetical protein
VASYRASFSSPFPRRNKAEWVKRWPVEYGKPPLVGATPVGFTLGELEVVDAFRGAGFTAYWTDAYGHAPAWTASWRLPEGPEQARARDIFALLRRISVAANNADSDDVVTSRKQAKPWDVIAWRGRTIRIVEFKQPSENFTVGQRKFAWGASLLGLKPELFGVVVGSISFPEARPVAWISQR